MTTLLELPVRHTPVDAQASAAHGATTSDRGHARIDAQATTAPVGTTPPTDSPEGQAGPDAQRIAALGGYNSETGAIECTTPSHRPRPSLFDPTLATLAALLDDIEGNRKAHANRVRILTADEPDEDGIIRGFGLDESHPAVGILTGLGDQLAALEHQTILALQRAMRQHPLAPWQKQAKGVGEKQLARLLASIGDPYLRTMPDGTEQPRTVSQLWAYCGLHNLPSGQSTFGAHGSAAAGATTPPGSTKPHPTPDRHPSAPGSHTAARRAKGVKANWSTDAKTRAYLIATSIVKQTSSPYRATYDARRAHTAETHPDWTAGHSHNDALRIVSKAILRDLWRAARTYHTGETE